jgi:hypothetical protein
LVPLFVETFTWFVSRPNSALYTPVGNARISVETSGSRATHSMTPFSV